MLTLVEAPERFVTLAEAKGHLGVVSSRQDAEIYAHIDAAIAYFDGPNGYLGACIGRQRWRWQTGAFTDPMRFPLGPAISFESVSYRNTDGDPTALDPSDVYMFADSCGPYLRPSQQWPTDVSSRDDAVTIEFTAGREVAPPQLKSAVLIIVGQLYRHKEVDVDVRTFATTFGAHDLAHPYRVSL